jgi:serine/threonine protein kinase/Tol biopolymer transport system component
MPLVPGSKLGPYEIVSPLGAGGMGEVYRAHDTRLGRDVALKILPQSFALDLERLHRFEQESRAVAAFNHPNILAIHDVGQHNGSPFLVSELLEGESLRAILDRGALPQRRAIDYGVQIAQGLAIAHAKEIVHRDLKPENLFLTKDGRVKILDFGLAKAIQKTASPSSDSQGATLTSAQTAAGVVMGTASYMAPEQVRGEAVDARTDIFAFGAVLYEMLSGHRAFRRDTSAETMTAVLKDDPAELTDAQPPISPALERIVRRCLEKSPEQRFQSAKDLAFALEALSGTSHSSAALAKTGTARRRPLTIAVAALCGIAALAGAYFAGTRSGSSKRAKFERLTFQRGSIKGARFTPDGQNVIYSASWDGRPYEVFSSHIGDHNARPLDQKNAIVVGVSASGEIALLTNVRRSTESIWMQSGTLARVSESGGAPREILEDVWDADISRDGKQFAVVRSAGGPQQLEYPIGKVLFKTNGYISHPRISPDGKRVAFLEHPIYGDDRGYLDLVDEGANAKRLTFESQGEEGVTWSPDGREIWYGAAPPEGVGERGVFAVTPNGKLRLVVNFPGYNVVWDVSSDGRLLMSDEAIVAAQMVASPANASERDVSGLGYGTYGALSADGKTIVFGESGKAAGHDYLVFFRRLDGSAAVEIGEGQAIGVTPDGKYAIAFLPSQPTKLRVMATRAGESGTLDVAPVSVDRALISWMPGGKEFVFLGHEGEAPPRSYRESFGGGPARPLTNLPGAHFWNCVSPDGKFVLETSAPANEPAQNVIVELATGKVRNAPLLQSDQPVQWDQDGAHAFVVQKKDVEATIFRVDLNSGNREVWKQIRPPDPAGILTLRSFFVTPSGSAYGYSVARALSSLYVYSEQ